jgi:hypothetical protein
MIDPVSALVVLGSLGAGWLLGRHARLKSAPPKPPQPICLCGHAYGIHDPETGACNEAHIKRENRGGFIYTDEIACPCLRYTGPQPVEQYWVPPAADMRIVTAPRPEIEQ